MPSRSSDSQHSTTAHAPAKEASNWLVHIRQQSIGVKHSALRGLYSDRKCLGVICRITDRPWSRQECRCGTSGPPDSVRFRSMRYLTSRSPADSSRLSTRHSAPHGQKRQPASLSHVQKYVSVVARLFSDVALIGAWWTFRLSMARESTQVRSRSNEEGHSARNDDSNSRALELPVATSERVVIRDILVVAVAKRESLLSYGAVGVGVYHRKNESRSSRDDRSEVMISRIDSSTKISSGVCRYLFVVRLSRAPCSST